MVSNVMYSMSAANGSDKSAQERDRQIHQPTLVVIGSNAESKAHPPPFRNRAGLYSQHFKGPWVRASELPALFCSWDLAYRCTSGGWLTPVIRGRRRTIYRIADVLHCLTRIESGELPPPRRSDGRR